MEQPTETHIQGITCIPKLYTKDFLKNKSYG